MSAYALPFGRDFREKYFTFEDNYVPLNHGSWGGVPKPVQEARWNALNEVYSNPDKFIRYTWPKRSKELRKQVANFIDADADSVVLVQNSTSAMNAVFRSYPFKAGDKVVFFSTIFESCRHTLYFLHDLMGVELVEVKLEYPQDSEQVVEAFIDAVDRENKESRVKFALFDTCSSQPSVLIPYEKLIQECRRRNVLSYVDGAHGIGHTRLSMREAQPDFFASNLHKWLFLPLQVALLYVAPHNHHLVHSLPISAVYIPSDAVLEQDKQATRLADQFEYTATSDYTPFMCIPAALKFRDEVCGGESKISEYNYQLAQQAGELFAKSLGTSMLQGHPAATMVMVQLPYKIDDPTQRQIERYLMDECHTFFPLANHGGNSFVRLSGQVYLELDDFKHGLAMLRKALDRFASAGQVAKAE